MSDEGLIPSGGSRASLPGSADVFVVCVTHWRGLFPGDRDSIAAHVRAHDHPETPSDMRSLLGAAGFVTAGGAVQELLRDAPGIHRLWALPRPDGADEPAALEAARCAS